MNFSLDKEIEKLIADPAVAADTDDSEDTAELEPVETDEEIIREAKERFRYCEDAMHQVKADALDDLEFVSGHQWNATTADRRKREGRPTMTVNKLSTVVNQVVNDVRQNKPGIKVRPVDSSTDPATASVINGIIRTVDISDPLDTATYYAVACGTGFLRVGTEHCHDKTFDQRMVVDRIDNPLSVYFPIDLIHKADFSDAPYCIVRYLTGKKQFKAKYPKADPHSWESGMIGDSDWVEEDSIWIAEYYRVKETSKKIYQLSDGNVVDEYPDPVLYPELEVINKRDTVVRKVERFVLTEYNILERDDIPSRYIPIVPILGQEINVNNRKMYVSLIRFAKDPQQILNHMTSSELEIIGLATKAQWLMPEGANEGHEADWLKSNKKNVAWLTYKPGINGSKPDRIDPPSIPAAVVNAIRERSDEIKSTTGIFDASLGAKGNETSGKAILSRQRQGDVATYHFAMSVTRAVRQIGRIMVDMIPVIYDVPRALRILGEDMTDEVVLVNQVHNTFNQDRRLYDLQTGIYDVTVECGPSYESRRIEAAEHMINLLQYVPTIGVTAPDLVIKNLDFPGASELAERMRRTVDPKLLIKDQMGANISEDQIRQIVADLEKQMATVQMLQAERQQMGQMIATLQKQLADKTQAEQIKADTAVIRATSEVQKSQLAVEQERIRQQGANTRAAVDTAVELSNQNTTGRYMPRVTPAP